MKDWKATDSEMLIKQDTNDSLKRKMGIVLKNKEKGNKFIRFIKNIVEAGRIKIALLQKYKMRYSLTELPENIEGVNWYAYN